MALLDNGATEESSLDVEDGMLDESSNSIHYDAELLFEERLGRAAAANKLLQDVNDELQNKVRKLSVQLKTAEEEKVRYLPGWNPHQD